VENPRTFHLIDADEAHYLRRMACDSKVVVLSDSFAAMSETVLTTHADQRIFCADPHFVDRVGIAPVPLPVSPPDVNILHRTLFETTALIDGVYGERLPVPPCTFNAFSRAWAILTHLQARRTLANLSPAPSFDPMFLDARGREAPFGTTERVVILSQNRASPLCLEAFEAAEWLKRKLFLPRGIKLECAIKAPVIRYDDAENLIKAIRSSWGAPGYALVFDMTRTAFLQALDRFGPLANDYTTKGLF
jgi:hypothetical protein